MAPGVVSADHKESEYMSSKFQSQSLILMRMKTQLAHPPSGDGDPYTGSCPGSSLCGPHSRLCGLPTAVQPELGCRTITDIEDGGPELMKDPESLKKLKIGHSLRES